VPSRSEAAATFAANRAHGHVSLALAATPTGVRRTVTREEGSLRARFPSACAGAPEAVLVNTAGGIAGGDRFVVDLSLDAGARLVVTTAAAEKVYRSLGTDSRFDVTAALADGAELTWLPQETILFDRARLARTITISLAHTAKLLLAETVVFGRAAMGETVREGGFADRWRIRRGGRLIYADSLIFAGATAPWFASQAGLGACRALATVLLVAPAAADRLAAVRARLPALAAEAGASAWDGMLALRIAARDGTDLRRALVALLPLLRDYAPLPRLWSC